MDDSASADPAIDSTISDSQHTAVAAKPIILPDDTTNDTSDSTTASIPTTGVGATPHKEGGSHHSPGSVGSRCSEDTAGGSTKSMSDEDDVPHNAAAVSTVVEADNREKAHTDPIQNNISTTSSNPPKFYRLNAFTKESDSSSAAGGGSESEDDEAILASAAASDDPCAEEALLRKQLGYDDDDDDDQQTSNANGTAFSTTCSDAPLPPPKRKASKKRGVQFKSVCIREYAITIGQNPYCSFGVPLTLDWNHGEEDVIPIDFYEASHKRKRTARHMLLNSFQRRDMLWRSGYPLQDIEKAIKENDREKFRRSMTLYFLPLLHIQEMIYFGAESCCGGRGREGSEAKRVEELVLRQQEAEMKKYRQQTDTEIGGMSVVQQFEQDRPQRRLSFKSQASQSSSFRGGGKDGGSVYNDWSLRSGSAFSEISHDRDDPYVASINSRFKGYAIRCDRGQHDKATEIILCNTQRPHMRAFHAAWMSFFTAFFMWFAVTPLLGEIKDTLHLTNQEIWTSSLCGSAGTILFRIIMGPACDKFGARVCMAFILATAAIPCALTGLVQTAQGLAITRTFIGIAGAAFVACQYWSSQMFTREVAGTANALVAGWGNLGGGVAQLVMGSALFPLFRVFYGWDDSDSQELAWRTVCVVPAVFSLAVAYVILYHCDDSPKGDYRERVRQQEITVVNPIASLCATAQNRNVWILLLQYGACFGVEVTMTNAAALYFRDEFGQTTVSAAAIASVFGIMNLFARGIGGFVSDLFNSKYGMRGRLTWQALTLFLEGIAIIIFGFAASLEGSIMALIFLSMMVQSAEGSTFGIVPYVDRRYLGSVVGWVGAGGTIGGAIFSVFFIQLNYRDGFVLMGLVASCSSVLTCFLNCEKLSKNAATLGDKGEMKKHEENVPLQHKNEAIGLTKDATISFAQLDGHTHSS